MYIGVLLFLIWYFIKNRVKKSLPFRYLLGSFTMIFIRFSELLLDIETLTISFQGIKFPLKKPAFKTQLTRPRNSPNLDLYPKIKSTLHFQSQNDICEVQLVQNTNSAKKQFIINMFKFSTSEPSSNTRSRKDSEIILPSEKFIQKLKYLNSFRPKDLVPPKYTKT